MKGSWLPVYALVVDVLDREGRENTMTLDQKWKDTMDAAAKDPKAKEYDAFIAGEVSVYNQALATTPGFKVLDWKWIKAMIWVESGGPTSAAWTQRVMQIGNKDDAAYGVLKSGTEGAELIMTDQLKKDIQTLSIDDPKLNIRAGIAYLLVKLCETTMKSVQDGADKAVYEYIVVPGDSFAQIATRVGTTVDELQAQNPTLHVLHPKDKVKYRKAAIKRVIVGWRAANANSIAARYNGGGDLAYVEKLNYVWPLIH